MSSKDSFSLSRTYTYTLRLGWCYQIESLSLSLWPYLSLFLSHSFSAFVFFFYHIVVIAGGCPGRESGDHGPADHPSPEGRGGGQGGAAAAGPAVRRHGESSRYGVAHNRGKYKVLQNYVLKQTWFKTCRSSCNCFLCITWTKKRPQDATIC